MWEGQGGADKESRPKAGPARDTSRRGQKVSGGQEVRRPGGPEKKEKMEEQEGQEEIAATRWQ